MLVTRYVSGFPSIIVKPLVSQAPLINFGGINMPSLEKVMVDITDDVEFSFAQGAELYTTFENLLSTFDVNDKALYRYADRRSRRSQIENIVNTCEPGTDVIGYLNKTAQDYGFGEVVSGERVSRTNVPKTQAKCYNTVSYHTNPFLFSAMGHQF